MPCKVRGVPIKTGETKDECVKAWGFERDIPYQLAIDAALHQVEPPDLGLVLIANRGDHITVQVLEGNPPLPDGFVYVDKRGLYEIVRAERWPAVQVGRAPRLLLTLRAYPKR
jgi:hypothetical protein